MAAQRVYVLQYCNPKRDSNLPPDSETNPAYIYEVTKTVNTIVEALGNCITPARLEGLIAQGIEVTVDRVK